MAFKSLWCQVMNEFGCTQHEEADLSIIHIWVLAAREKAT